MTKPVMKAETLVTDDGITIDAVHLAGDSRLVFVLAHGFTLNWQRPSVWRVARRLNRFGGVVAFDFRGHGRSGGASTLGDREISDLDVAMRYARELGYERLVTVGFSMGASIVLRHAGLLGGEDAVISVSGPGRWYYRGTLAMRRVHLVVEHKLGRMIVHGDKDEYFPADHAEQLFEAAHQPKELWIVPGFAHAETGAENALLDRIGSWAVTAVSDAIAPDVVV
jgi:pimeloyl-ACP methyl ester carboxylesterase